MLSICRSFMEIRRIWTEIWWWCLWFWIGIWWGYLTDMNWNLTNLNWNWGVVIRWWQEIAFRESQMMLGNVALTEHKFKQQYLQYFQTVLQISSFYPIYSNPRLNYLFTLVLQRFLKLLHTVAFLSRLKTVSVACSTTLMKTDSSNFK